MSASPPHHDPRLVALVAVGGMLGTGARYGLSTVVGSSGGWPTATFVANVTGSFLLGVLLEALLRRGPETSRGRLVRLGLGTGVLGGFTTFSSLAIELERLLAAGAVGTAAAYAAASLACGVLACLLGVVLGAPRHPTPGPQRVDDPGGAAPRSGGPAGAARVTEDGPR